MIPSVFISLLLFDFSAQTNWQHKYSFAKTETIEYLPHSYPRWLFLLYLDVS